ncbi:hypothetical protein [Ornithinimicrobium panacihumi]|uniref:hypothetical protein n=1 Tax=Ornithinimicrobium panacihumi TaxID=2008449 RepID=UPI003F89D0EA
MTENTNAVALTDDEQDMVRRSAFGAIALVSQADPGFFAMFKESMAGSKAFQEAPAGVQELLREGGLPTPPTGSREEVQQTVLSELGQSMQVLQAKAPQQAAGYRDVILAAADRVANASDGVAPEEQAMIEQIRGALGGGAAAPGGAAGTTPQAPTAPSAPQQPAQDQSGPGALDYRNG